MTKTAIDLSSYIRNIPDFPKPGIQFKDITTLLQNKDAFRQAVDAIVEEFRDKKIEAVVAVEARGFILGGAVAHGLGAGFVPVRKKGKLPYTTAAVTYELEYGTDTLEIHDDALKPGERVLVVDDLLATGGTVSAVCDLLDKQEAAIMGVAFLIELEFLKGRAKFQDHDVFALIKY